MALSEKEELELLELEEAEANAQPQDFASFRESIEPGIMDETRPVEQRLLDNVNAAGAGLGVAQLAGLAGKGLVRGGEALANSKSVGGVRDWLAKKFEGASLDNSFQAMGGTKATAKELGEEGVNSLARLGRDEGIVGQYDSAKTMLDKVQPMKQAAGEGIGALRKEGDAMGAAPALDDLLAQADSQYGRKFSRGLESTGGAEFRRAKEELGDLVAPQTTDYSELATRMNDFARNERSMLRPNNATTNVADLVSGTNDANLVQSLGADKGLDYVNKLDKFGELTDAEQLLKGLRSGERVGSAGLPMSRLGMLSQGINKIAPSSARTHWYHKMAQTLQTNPQAFGRNTESLMRAMKQGKASLNSTIYMLQQQDPEFKQQFEQLNQQ